MDYIWRLYLKIIFTLYSYSFCLNHKNIRIKLTFYTELSAGYKTDSPKYTKQWLKTRSEKNARLSSDSTSLSRGLQEPWESYDKCAKRNRLGKSFKIYYL